MKSRRHQTQTESEAAAVDMTNYAAFPATIENGFFECFFEEN